MLFLRAILSYWLARFIFVQVLAVSGCWIIFHLPMYCVYGSYATTVFFVNLCQWPTKEWLGIGIPTQVRDSMVDQPPDKRTYSTLRKFLDSKKIEAVVVCNRRVDDTNDLADTVREQFFLKSVVYVMFILAVAVASGFGPKAKKEGQGGKGTIETQEEVAGLNNSSPVESAASPASIILLAKNREVSSGDSAVASGKSFDVTDWFKALVLFIILAMGLLWDLAICFYQRKLNERCHDYSVLAGPVQHP